MTSNSSIFAPDIRRSAQSVDVTGRLLAGLPPEFARWSFLAQDQYLEIRTLLSGYILSSQGDRMLMAHSVEGRFPFLDMNVVRLAESLPPSFKLPGLREKYVLKRAAVGLVPPSIIQRTKQPFRAPDAMAFAGPDRPDWVADVLSDRSVGAAGLFDPGAVANLRRKLLDPGPTQTFSNSDNMAIVGVLSTGLLHESLIRQGPRVSPAVAWTTSIDRVSARSSERSAVDAAGGATR